MSRILHGVFATFDQQQYILGCVGSICDSMYSFVQDKIREVATVKKKN